MASQARGEMRAATETVVQNLLRRQGITVSKIKKLRLKSGGKITDKDITLFTRQLATMMKSGVPLLQSFDIVGRGHANPAVGRLLLDIKSEVETGSSLSQAFRKYPLYFDALFCNLVGAGEQAGILETLLDRLATYKGKNPRHQEQNQESLVLSHCRAGGGVRDHGGDHDFRDSSVQGSICKLWRRIAVADAGRDRYFGLFRGMVVGDFWGDRRQHLRFP